MFNNVEALGGHDALTEELARALVDEPPMGTADGGFVRKGYHPRLDELVEMRRRLDAAGALVGASDHHVNKSLYCRDPDGLEFEVMWLNPPANWGAQEHDAIVAPLDLEGDLARYGGSTSVFPDAVPSQGSS